MRTVTMTPLVIIMVKPTPRTAGSSEGESEKSGGAPLGFGARGIIDGSMPGGRDPMLKLL